MSVAWTVAARFSSIGEAAVARSALDAAGIETYLADENVVAIDWLVSQAVGALKLMVHDGDVERARELLTTLVPAGSIAVEEVTPPDVAKLDPKCPECGSSDVRRAPRFRIFLLLAALFIGIGVAIGQTEIALMSLVAAAAGAFLIPAQHCANCGHRWHIRAERKVKAPLPDRADIVETPCRRCGSLDVYRIQYRRLKSIPLLFGPAIVFVAPILWLSPRWRCDACGLKVR